MADYIDPDIQPEPVLGLPEAPPEGEHILWQGAPTIWSAAAGIYRFNWVIGWFGFLALWRGTVAYTDGGSVASAVGWSLLAGVIAAAILFTMAWATARTTIYTITNRRVGMRIGVALTLTLNLPHQWIDSADLRVRRGGRGDIALTLKGDERISYLVLWPHARPWKLNPAVPMLRGIADAEKVAAMLGEAARARIAEVAARDAVKAPVPAAPKTPEFEPEEVDGGLSPVPAE